jgi:hypothetical protein
MQFNIPIEPKKSGHDYVDCPGLQFLGFYFGIDYDSSVSAGSLPAACHNYLRVRNVPMDSQPPTMHFSASILGKSDPEPAIQASAAASKEIRQLLRQWLEIKKRPLFLASEDDFKKLI